MTPASSSAASAAGVIGSHFELGYARAFGKTVVTIARLGTAVHVDVRDWSLLEYIDSRPLERDLVKVFRELAPPPLGETA